MPDTSSTPLLPGSTIGMLGGGQLGRMFALAAAPLGYRVHVFDPNPHACAAPVSALHTCASFDDKSALSRFAESVDVVTLEFENIPSSALEHLAGQVSVCPGPNVLHTIQNRLREKQFVADQQLPTAPFSTVNSLADLTCAVDSLGTPCILKTAGFGYDGKGQVRIASTTQAEEAWQAVGEQPCVLEGFVPFEQEASVIIARNPQGATRCFPIFWNEHADHILDVSSIPSPFDETVESTAKAMARRLADAFDLVGLLCVELFVMSDGKLIINELAPRPHNSGHLTIEACAVSQFEQQLRAVCGLSLDEPTIRRPAAMGNLLGDRWQNGEPAWDEVMKGSECHLHLYDKGEPRARRKMGHITVLADDVETARRRLLDVRERVT